MANDDIMELTSTEFEDDNFLSDYTIQTQLKDDNLLSDYDAREQLEDGNLLFGRYHPDTVGG